ncbi:prolyl oligopeptidase family serine peptidase [Tamlana crocina]|uniref:prolyl oligopeptidase n=1 Tax=Tamlana crocina TaxID=393006 RepID=A0ABX1D6E9_9FLAO|nr:prolyl oligopeptidase family serine peptidase [Tamlana crocina]NJX13922.1 S9 family peptidase [Tamlana crocina]
MRKLLFSCLCLVLIASCKNQLKTQTSITVNYPETKTEDTTDHYFGVPIKDPYRWLEDDMSTETAQWVKAQNNTTFGYLNQITFKDDIKKRLSSLWNYEKIGAPFKEGAYTYFYKNNGLQNQNVLYRKDENNTEEVFIDPNTFSDDGTISLDDVSFSKDGELMAYSISEGGSDWRKIIVLNTETKAIIEDTLVDIKFSQISWYKNEGFYYSSYDKPKGSQLSAKTDQHKVYFHKIGTPQAQDQLIYGGSPEQKHRYIYANVTIDDKYLVITPRISTSGNKLLIKNLSNENNPLIPVLTDTNSSTTVISSQNDDIFLLTNLNAPNKKVVKLSLDNPAPEHWEDVIPETENVLSISTSGKYLIAEYMVDAISQVKQYDYNGNLIRSIDLPGIGNANNFGSKKEDTFDYFSFTNYYTPSSIYKLNLETGETTLYWKPSIAFNPEDYESKQVFYTSKDGTKVPMIITHKKGITLNGTNPTILYGYGGFNVSLNPAFSVGMAVWMEQGGIYAVPNLRGGGEYGRKWHDAGTKMQKQNVFDDFIAAAEYLIENNYTSSKYLALRGGSNGGLLVGAVMTQRPDLAQVALPAVGVLDMLRYHTFTAGAGWAYDYGTAEDSKAMFEYLKGYSPLHNVKSGTEYPATLITTADHDDRVVPAHSFKFAAELQSKQSGDNPVLIRIETDAGHGAGTPVSKIIEQYADMFAFTWFNMSLTV